jgi:hypothetical protein
MNYYLGIDPGLNGGYALTDENKNLVRFGPLPQSTDELYKLFINLLDYADLQIQACTEKPYMVARQGGVSTMFVNYGRIITILELLKIKYKEIRSQEWLKKLNLKKENKKDKPSIRYCLNFYSIYDFRKTKKSKKIQDGITDAVCISLFLHS